VKTCTETFFQPKSFYMPTARETFDSSIKDATELLEHFNAINVLPPPPNAEVLKRAGLIMACTAWETYVEDRVQEAVVQRLGEGNDSFQNRFVLRHLQMTLKQFNNPSAEPRWPPQTAPLMAGQTAPGRTVGW
jgi:RiboL-PSP-HEPN